MGFFQLAQMSPQQLATTYQVTAHLTEDTAEIRARIIHGSIKNVLMLHICTRLHLAHNRAMVELAVAAKN